MLHISRLFSTSRPSVILHSVSLRSLSSSHRSSSRVSSSFMIDPRQSRDISKNFRETICKTYRWILNRKASKKVRSAMARTVPVPPELPRHVVLTFSTMYCAIEKCSPAARQSCPLSLNISIRKAEINGVCDICNLLWTIIKNHHNFIVRLILHQVSCKLNLSIFRKRTPSG